MPGLEDDVWKLRIQLEKLEDHVDKLESMVMKLAGNLQRAQNRWIKSEIVLGAKGNDDGQDDCG